MKLSLSYPVKPVHVNQNFGASPSYYAKFHDQFGNPYKGHDGTDFMAVHGQPVYASIDGLASYSTDVHGGEGVTINTTEALDYPGGTCWFSVLHWHMIGDTDPKYPKPFRGTIAVKKGDLIGYADNTGAPYESSGDHLHLGLKPVDKNYKLLAPGNGYNGGIDPLPFFGLDDTTAAVVEQGIALAQEAVAVPAVRPAAVSLLKALLNFLNPFT